MTLQIWRPFAELRRHNYFNTRFGFPFYGSRPGFGVFADARNGNRTGTWQIPLDIVDKGDELVVSASVPGIDPNDIKINIDDGVLTIRAETLESAATENGADVVESDYLRRERRSGSFTRAVQLPDSSIIRRLIKARQLRAQYFDAGLFADPAWDILLDLAAARSERRRVSVTSLCIAAGVPATTALRWIGQMVDADLLMRVSDPHDRRRAYIALADTTADAMASYLAEVGAAELASV